MIALAEPALPANWWKELPDVFGETIKPGWNAYRWIEHVSLIVYTAILNGNGRVIVNVPPQFGKSTFLTEVLPAWFLEKFPDRNVITGSHGTKLARRSGRNTRNLIRTGGGMGVRLSKDSTAKDQWNTDKGGGMLATSLGSGLMGSPFHLALIDDLYGTWEDAQSPAYRADVIDWFQNTLYNRRRPDSTIIVLMTRFHPEDLSGWLIEKHSDPWQVVRLPALAEADDPLGRAPGESLCPEMWSEAELERSRRGGTQDGWESMYQQAPKSTTAYSAYRNFSEANVDATLALRPDLPLDISWDFNTNPGCHCIVGQYDQAEDRFTAVHEIHSPRMPVDDGMDQLKALIDKLGGFKWPRLRIFGDSTFTTRAAGYGVTHYQTVEAKVRSFGWVTPSRCVRPAAPRVADRMNCFNEVLYTLDKDRRYKVHPRCERLLFDFRNQRVAADGAPDKSNQAIGHAGDAEGYRVQYLRPMIQPGKLKLTGARFITS